MKREITRQELLNAAAIIGVSSNYKDMTKVTKKEVQYEVQLTQRELDTLTTLLSKTLGDDGLYDLYYDLEEHQDVQGRVNVGNIKIDMP